MAIFGKTKKTTEKKSTPVATTAPAVITAPVASVAGVIIRPRVTEKSGILSQSAVYTFEVAKHANKNTVAHAVKALYKVVPVRVAIINSPAKNVFVRGRRGVVSGIKKAVVTLKKGDTIDFV